MWTQCPADIDLGGSNTLMLSWSGSIPGENTSIPTRTTVWVVPQGYININVASPAATVGKNVQLVGGVLAGAITQST